MVENESVANHSAMGWAESIKWGVKTPAIVHGRVRDNVEKQNVNEKKSTNDSKMKIKNEMKNINNKIKIQQKPPRMSSQGKYYRWEFLTLKEIIIQNQNLILALPLTLLNPNLILILVQRL